MGGKLIEQLCTAIGYPEKVPEGVASFEVICDDTRVEVREDAGRLMLVVKLLEGAEAEGAMVSFAGFAAGRLLRESAVLAFDPDKQALILWDAVDAGGDMLQFFQGFMTACDWWMDRVKELDEPPPALSDVFIMP